MFKRVLIANRGEIAVRIARTLRRLGVESVVLASIPDRRSLAVRSADDWVSLEGQAATDTYLDQDAVIVAAKEKGCEAIHPGYGFLAENPAFAARCSREGIVFVGPSPDALERLGDKATARTIAVEAGVPVVPGYDGLDSDELLTAEAARIGFPLLVKARAGGGGRGMRVIQAADEFDEAVASARREAAAAFGYGSLLLEKLIEGAHHVEVQVIGDTRGALIHLGERDCSVQRRHQKVIEEAPSPVVDAVLRDELTSAALRIATSLGYSNAGTFEFLVGQPHQDGTRPFWFIEANPRLQVEHPVTEAITGLDLVELQLRVAAGEPLGIVQDDVRFRGHATEVRLYAEDPTNGFAPQTGRVSEIVGPSRARLDAGYEAGDTVPANYDTLIAKLIAHAPSRDESLETASEALEEMRVEGVPTNRELCRTILSTDAFGAGEVTVDWLDRQVGDLVEEGRPPGAVWLAVAAAVGLTSPWLGAGDRIVWLSDGAETRALMVGRESPQVAMVSATDGESARVALETAGEASSEWVSLALRVADLPGGDVTLHRHGNRVTCAISGRSYELVLSAPPPLARKATSAVAGATAITAPLSGTVAATHVTDGDEVDAAQLLVTLEAMKMEHRIVAPSAGIVRVLHVTSGSTVAAGDVLVEMA